jgi:hypothetical protein
MCDLNPASGKKNGMNEIQRFESVGIFLRTRLKRSLCDVG